MLVGILQNYIQKILSKNKLRMLLAFNYFLIDVNQIIYLSTLFAAEPHDHVFKLSKLKYLYHTPIQLVGADKNVNVSKLQWCCVGIKIQLHIYIQKVYRKIIKKICKIS
jgi:hypothetical protein